MYKLTVFAPLICLLFACGGNDPNRAESKASVPAADSAAAVANTPEVLEAVQKAKTACLSSGQGKAFCDCVAKSSAEMVAGLQPGQAPSKQSQEAMSKCASLITRP